MLQRRRRKSARTLRRIQAKLRAAITWGSERRERELFLGVDWGMSPEQLVRYVSPEPGAYTVSLLLPTPAKFISIAGTFQPEDIASTETGKV